MASGPLAQLNEGEAPRATSFIVTIYGDVVVPRGGVLAMTTLIEVCEEVGISESLVRTAVSRLVAAGRLTGERVGRRSFYRLTPDTLVEFQAAARLIYAIDDHAATGWLLVPDAAPAQRDMLIGSGFRPMTGSALVAADHGQLADNADVLFFRMQAGGGRSALTEFAETHFETGTHGQSYGAFIARFAPVHAMLTEGAAISDAQAMAIRLLLVHHYRTVLLRDPRLPVEALPEDWPGDEAMRLFAKLYQFLSPQAERHIGTRFSGENGAMFAQTDETKRRANSLNVVINGS